MYWAAKKTMMKVNIINYSAINYTRDINRIVAILNVPL